MYGLMTRGSDRGLLDLFDGFDRYFTGRTAENFGIRTDITDNGDSYLMEAELPGFDKKDIAVEVTENLLTVSASRSEEREQKEGRRRISRERRYGSFTRSFDITGIDGEGIEAGYENGVLKLILPKVRETKPEKKRIELA